MSTKKSSTLLELSLRALKPWFGKNEKAKKVCEQLGIGVPIFTGRSSGSVLCFKSLVLESYEYFRDLVARYMKHDLTMTPFERELLDKVTDMTVRSRRKLKQCFDCFEVCRAPANTEVLRTTEHCRPHQIRACEVHCSRCQRYSYVLYSDSGDIYRFHRKSRWLDYGDLSHHEAERKMNEAFRKKVEKMERTITRCII